ncbi:2'-deoxynucleoside 5'-phosphate N-hydrolase 1 [Lethenteron reissneri]|uniref:2'-deoxynucleoside 5'-phosphate N-hydrolase 1 n=1 Tax=Lethenteron reissneri TaxID=7753 RepID=UPI002AB6D902|nr:2'-deoxynucleoside 5'-phosphate N-hydrolase 1 [Lethenteron reissneri]
MAPLIYFCGSVRGGRGDAALYAALVGHLQSHGRVLTAHVGCQELGASGEANLDEAYIYRRDMEWLEQADVVVAEVTQPSLGVGYEIGRAVAMKKNILCLFRPSSGWALSAMIRGTQENEGVQVKDYSEEKEACDIITQFLNTLQQPTTLP